MHNRESFVNTPFMDDQMNNKKPENYPQNFHYASAKTEGLNPNHKRDYPVGYHKELPVGYYRQLPVGK